MRRVLAGWRAAIAVAGIVLLAGAPSLAAQTQCNVVGTSGATCVTQRTMTATVRKHVRLTITPTLQPLGSPTAEDYNAGFSVHPAATIEVKANVNWQVSVRSNNGQWTESGAGARPTKPRADLSWGTSASGPWTVMTNTAAPFATGSATDSELAVVFFRIDWSWILDTPGSYTINVLFTVSTT